MSFECKFCKKLYVSKGNLKTHQKTAKYCLDLQKNFEDTDIQEDIKNMSYVCIYCNKSFTSKQRYNSHSDICVLKFKKTISILENKVSEHEKTISDLLNKINVIAVETEVRILREQNERSTSTVEEIAKQPRITSTTNNNQKVLINTPMDMSYQTLNTAIQNGFSDDYLIQGQKGVARFAYDNILKDEQGKLKYICTDAARQIFQFKNEDGSIQKDVKATKLTKALLDGELKSTSHKMACDKMKDGSAEEFNMYTDNYYDIKDLETDNSDFSKELRC
jgi:hypothetical protein